MATGARFKMHVEGLDTFLRQMDGWHDTIKKRVIRSALRSGANPIRREAKANLRERTGHAPTHRGPEYVPGTLKKSFTTRQKTYRGNTMILVLGPSWAKAGKHAHLVEKGTAHRTHADGSASGGAMPAFQFMLDAFLETHDEVQDTMAEKMVDGMAAVIEGRL